MNFLWSAGFLFFQGLQLFRKFGIQLVAAQHGDNVGVERSYEGNISKNIQDFVAYQLIRETGYREASVLRVNHRIFQGAPLPRPIFLMASSSQVNPMVLAEAISLM